MCTGCLIRRSPTSWARRRARSRCACIGPTSACGRRCSPRRELMTAPDPDQALGAELAALRRVLLEPPPGFLGKVLATIPELEQRRLAGRLRELASNPRGRRGASPVGARALA